MRKGAWSPSSSMVALPGTRGIGESTLKTVRFLLLTTFDSACFTASVCSPRI